MAVKTTGAEFKRFYADKAFWPSGRYHDDAVVTIDGKQDDDADLDNVHDDAVMTLDGGVVLQPGEGGRHAEIDSFDGHFKKWKKKQTTTVFIVECPLAAADTVREAIVKAGGKVK